MTKAELIKNLANAAEVTNKQAEAVLNALVGTIHGAVSAGNELSISDLGKFSVNKREARNGRNPATGEAMQIPAKTVPHFTAAKALKDAAAG